MNDQAGMNDQPWQTVISNVRVFDSRTGQLGPPSDIVVNGNLIASIDSPAEPTARSERRIEGGGRVVIPGLIDAHWHSSFAAVPLPVIMQADPNYVQLISGQAAAATLLRGFTTVRDAGGPAFGLKSAIDGGVLPGPRMYPSGAMISQTGGHGDFRSRHDVPRGRLGPLSHPEMLGGIAIADGPAEVLRACREQLMLGATQLKLMAGGGAASLYDPLDVTQYTEDELRAAVESATNWGTYVMVHAYTPRAVQQAVHAGVACIEHGHLLDEETVAMMTESGTWWCLQPFLDDQDMVPLTGPNRVKQLQLIAGTDNAYRLARKHGANLAWGSDTLFDPALTTRQGAQLAKVARWMSPAEVLSMGTLHNAELLALSGPRNCYSQGPLGVVEPGAYADLIVVDGNPLEDIELIGRPDEVFSVIMKDGAIVKNAL